MWTTFAQVPARRVFHLNGVMDPTFFTKVNDTIAEREGGQQLGLAPHTKVWFASEPPPENEPFFTLLKEWTRFFG